MKVREKILDSIKNMDAGELSFLYQQIKLMEMMKIRPSQKREPLSIKKIHQMTSSSAGSWSQAVCKDREDRS